MTEATHRRERRSIRRTSMSRLVAVCLLLLAVSPFTVPFSTFQAVLFTHSAHGSDASTKSKSSLDESTIGTTIFQLATLSSGFLIRRFAGAINDDRGRLGLHSILRI